MKIQLSLIFLFFLYSLTVHSDNGNGVEKDNTWSERLSEFKEQIEKIKKNSKKIYSVLDIYQLDIVEEEYTGFQSQLSEVEEALKKLTGSESTTVKNEFYDLFESALDSYNTLVNYYDFYMQLENKKEAWSNQYFKLWEQTYALKTRVEKIYVKEEKMNVHYGGMSDYKYTSVYKRNLYEACNIYYNANIMKLKGTGDCDHYERIQILENVIPVMRKCEKLAYEEDTRDLEKALRRKEDAGVIEKLILNY